MTQTKKDDPHDDCTHWAGQIPKTYPDSDKHLDKRDTRRQSKPDTVSEELGVETKG